MKVIDPGHVYNLDWLDGDPQQRCDWKDGVGEGNVAPENRLTFVKREGPGYPGNVGRHPGTNIQEVLRALIDRVKYLDAQVPHQSNVLVLNALRRAIFNLEVRAAERHGRLDAFSVPAAIELEPTCAKCGHVGCGGECRP